MKRLFLAITFVVAGFVSSPSPSAQTNPSQSIRFNDWTISGYRTRDGSAFSHCSAYINYTSGRQLLFSINSGLYWSIGLANPEWNLAPSGTLPIQYRVDQHPPRAAMADIREPGFITLLLTEHVPVFAQMRGGQLFMVRAAGEEMRFQITDIHAVLQSLARCGTSRGADVSVSR